MHWTYRTGHAYRPLERDDFSSNRHVALGYAWSMIFSENRYPLFGIMLSCTYCICRCGWISCHRGTGGLPSEEPMKRSRFLLVATACLATLATAPLLAQAGSDRPVTPCGLSIACDDISAASKVRKSGKKKQA